VALHAPASSLTPLAFRRQHFTHASVEPPDQARRRARSALVSTRIWWCGSTARRARMRGLNRRTRMRRTRGRSDAAGAHCRARTAHCESHDCSFRGSPRLPSIYIEINCAARPRSCLQPNRDSIRSRPGSARARDILPTAERQHRSAVSNASDRLRLRSSDFRAHVGGDELLLLTSMSAIGGIRVITSAAAAPNQKPLLAAIAPRPGVVPRPPTARDSRRPAAGHCRTCGVKGRSSECFDLLARPRCVEDILINARGDL